MKDLDQMQQSDVFTETLAAYHAAIAELEKATITPQSYMAAPASDADTTPFDPNAPHPQQFFLDRCQSFFDSLGNPEKGFQVIHITGTSGKGSTSTMVYEALRADGRRVGIYKSPYVTTAIENIEAHGDLIDAATFTRLIHEVLPIVNQIRVHNPRMVPSYAEVFFGIAMKYFQEAGIDWLVLEVGCGGRFDKTNIIPAPIAIGLTPIGYDHTDILGDTLSEIAWHKAGIIKKGVHTVISNETKPEVRAVFDAEAAKHGLTIQYVHADHSTGAGRRTTMLGEHQQENAAVAAAIARACGVSEQAIAQGLLYARLPARCEMISTGTGHSPRILIDGAHSEPKMAALMQVLDEIRRAEPWRQLITIFAAKEGKDTDALVAPLAQISSKVILTSFTLPGFSSYTPQQIKKFWQSNKTVPGVSREIIIENEPLDAIGRALQIAKPEDFILVTGSLYLAGMVREYFIPEHEIVASRSVFPHDLRAE